MSRIEFDGQGTPIPKYALPPFGAESDLPTTVLTFTANTNFSVSDYVSLGFTHYEVWCVGGAGGRGGDSTDQILWADTSVRRPVPLSVWNLHLELVRITDYFTASEWDHIYSFGPNPAMPNNGLMTMVQYEEYINPTHLLTFRVFSPVELAPDMKGMGGGGGGGGFQKVSGVLADLPGVVPIVVGKGGIDAGYGQVKQNGTWTPDIFGDPTLSLFTTRSTTAAYPLGRQNELYNYFDNYLNSYPTPHRSFSNPQKGQDGGASTFAGTVCQASGGIGGDPGMRWNGTSFVPDGDGGAGGIGGSSTAGGGASGSSAEGVNGSDGIWYPDTGIGSGGGGGKGGRASTGGYYTSQGIWIPLVQHLATAGGQGSYSFGDTTVYGQRQFRQPWSYLKPLTVPGSGVYTYQSVIDTANLIVPGGGGGARPLPTLKYGGHVSGYSPDGIVVIRLAKIT